MGGKALAAAMVFRMSSLTTPGGAQAPITDWFVGDDFHHNGALWLPHAFRFLTNFGKVNDNPTRWVAWQESRGKRGRPRLAGACCLSMTSLAAGLWPIH